MGKDKRDIIQQALDTCKAICLKDGQNIDDSRALEFIAIEFIQQHQYEHFIQTS